MGHPYAVLQAQFAGLITTVIALATLLRPMGILGAAVASLCSYATVTGILLLNAKRHMNVSVRTLFNPRTTEIRMVIAKLTRAFLSPQIQSENHRLN
jgi:O-antigen/teichoic acid export membrane protein